MQHGYSNGTAPVVKVHDLRSAVAVGDMEAVQRYVAAGADVNAVYPVAAYHISLFEYALANGHDEIALYLLQHGLDNGKIERKGAEALLCTAAEQGSAEIIDALLDRGTEINSSDGNNTPLELAVRSRRETRGSLYNPRYGKERNPQAGLERVHRLLERGADPNLSSGTYPGPLEIAAADGQLDTMELLLKYGAKPRHTYSYAFEKPYGISASEAKEKGMRTAKKLQELGVKPDSVSLCDAVDYAGVEAVEFLLANGADVNGRDRQNDWTALHHACGGTYDSDNYAEKALLLLRYGADPSAVSLKKGLTPLFYACKWDSRKWHDVVRKLLQKGADPNARTGFGSTPMHLAALTGDKTCIDLLLEYGADINAIDNKSRTPWDIARSCKKDEICDYLSKQGGTSASACKSK